MLKVWVPTDWSSIVPVAVKSVAWQHSEITVDGGLGMARIVGDDAASVAGAWRRIRRLVR